MSKWLIALACAASLAACSSTHEGSASDSQMSSGSGATSSSASGSSNAADTSTGTSNDVGTGSSAAGKQVYVPKTPVESHIPSTPGNPNSDAAYPPSNAPSSEPGTAGQ